jgi:hypothetical protein
MGRASNGHRRLDVVVAASASLRDAPAQRFRGLLPLREVTCPQCVREVTEGGSRVADEPQRLVVAADFQRIHVDVDVCGVG